MQILFLVVAGSFKFLQLPEIIPALGDEADAEVVLSQHAERHHPNSSCD